MIAIINVSLFLAKLAALIYGDGNWPVHIQAYKCSKNSPHKPQWTTTKPKVMWTHIFCGQITSQGIAQGFHSQSTLTGYSVCVAPFGCTYNKPSGNGYCSIVKIRSSDTSGVVKAGGSSMFPKFKGPTDIINIIVQLCKVCKPPIGSKTLCVKGCNYRGNPNKFDIFMIMDNYGNVISAYPRTCSSTPQCTGRCSNL